MKIKQYSEVEIGFMRSTEAPDQLVSAALQLTQRKDVEFHKKVSEKTLKYLVSANHTSVLEHCSATFIIRNVSRSFLAQITRHRMASYTASSQHYQDYADYPVVVSATMANDDMALNSMRQCLGQYQELIEYKDEEYMPKWEARQVLPNASACAIIWTINARSLVNFLNLRLCKRNVPEMVNFAKELHAACWQWWHGLFRWIGPDCAMRGECTQGKMSCGEPYDKIE